MPIINGRLHLPAQQLTSRQKAAYGVGVGVAVLFVVVAWWMTAGQPTLAAFITGIGRGMGSVVERADAMRSEAVETGSPGVDAARATITDILKDAQTKKAAADIVAEQLKPLPPVQPL